MNKNILFIVQNNSFPFDKRVMREAVTLKKENNNVFVLSPVSEYDKEFNSDYNGIKVKRYKDYVANGKMLDYVFEYFNSMVRIYYHALKIIFKDKIQIIHVGNPPDFFWPLALICKLFGTKFIYDQHDLAPEMSKNKFQNNLVYKLLLLNEKLSVKFSDAIIVVNSTFKERLINKWKMSSQKCSVVYNGPPENFVPMRNELLIQKYEDKKVVLYIGLMTLNDNVEVIIHTANELINNRNRNDLIFILVGDGDSRVQAEKLSSYYGINNNVVFTGIVDHAKVEEYLYIADVCIAPDLPNGLNEYLTLVKILEYMKCSKAFVSFKLKETMEFSKDSGLYAEDEIDFADKIELLADNPKLEKEMGERGNKIISEKYLWSHSEVELLKSYQIAINKNY